MKETRTEPEVSSEIHAPLRSPYCRSSNLHIESRNNIAAKYSHQNRWFYCCCHHSAYSFGDMTVAAEKAMCAMDDETFDRPLVNWLSLVAPMITNKDMPIINLIIEFMIFISKKNNNNGLELSVGWLSSSFPLLSSSVHTVANSQFLQHSSDIYHVTLVGGMNLDRATV